MNEDLANRFIEAATRPLENDPPARDEARGELMGRLDFAAPGREVEVDAAAARLESSTPGKWPWQAIALAVVLLGVTVMGVLQALAITADMRSLFGLDADGRPAFKDPAELSAEQRDFLGGVQDPNTGSLFDFAKLRETFPDDPAIFEAAMDFHIARAPVPPDYRSTWRRIDPDNGMWSFKVTMKKMIDAVDHSAGSVRDETAFAEGWAAFEEAVTAKRFHSHGDKIRERYLSLLKPVETVPGELRQVSIWHYLTYNLRFSSPETLTNAVKIQAERLEAAKDIEGFRKLIASWKEIHRRLAEDAKTQEELFYLMAFSRANNDLRNVALRMGATQEKEEMDRLDMALTPIGVASAPSFRKMSAMARFAVGISEIDVGDEAFKPGRLAEYAFVDRVVVILALAGLVLTGTLVCIESVRRGTRLNGLADGLGPLFTTADHLRIAGLGVALPLLWYLGITHLTPLGCRDYGIIEFPVPPSLIQALATYLLAGVMIIQTARWRITQRAGFLALGSRRLIVGWITALLAAAVVPLTGTVRYVSGNTDDFLIAMALTCGIPLLWLLWQGGAMLFSPGSGALGGVLLSRRVAWPLAGLCVLLTASFPLLSATEKKWLARDEITHREVSTGGLTKLEMLSVKKSKDTYLEVLGKGGPPAK